MSDPTTPNLGFTLPTVGADNNTWGGILDADWTQLDTMFPGAALGIANGGTGGTTASAARTALGLGTAATQSIGTGGATVPLLSASVTWTGTITASGFSGPLTGNVTGNVSGSAGSCTGNAATATKALAVNDGSTGGSMNFGSAAVAGNAPEVMGTADGVNIRPYGTGNLSVASAAACTGNAATATLATNAQGLAYAAGTQMIYDPAFSHWYIEVGGTAICTFDTTNGVTVLV